jgi:hypothetical protein
VRVTTQAELDDRYGRTKRSTTRLWIVIAAIVGLVAVVVIGWSVVQQSRSTVSFDDLGFEVVDSGHVDVRYRVTMPTDDDAVCVLEALDESFAKVGWEVVDVPASDALSSEHTTTMRTVDTATTGHVVSCFVR